MPAMKPSLSLSPVARSACLVLLLAAALGTAHAGRSCEDKPLTPQSLQKGLDLAQRTSQALDAEYAKNGTRVVLLARVGQDLSKYDLHYSHYHHFQDQFLLVLLQMH